VVFSYIVMHTVCLQLYKLMMKKPIISMIPFIEQLDILQLLGEEIVSAADNRCLTLALFGLCEGIFSDRII